MKVFILIVFVLDATDKFGDPTGGVVALVCVEVFFLDTGVLTVDFLWPEGVWFGGVCGISVS